MNTKTCPFLGMKDDPSTALGFPTPGNFCQHARPVSPVKLAYQERVCLTGEHITCPLYQAANPVPMPAEIVGQPPASQTSKRAAAIFAIPLLLAGAAALILAWNVFGQRSGLQSRLVPGTGAEQQTTAGWMLITDTPFVLASPTSNRTPDAATNCAIPTGWEPYTVSPTDSLYRLSVIYGIDVEELQRVNCMGNSTTILPGQVIYIPFLPTRTPSSTPTRIPFVPTDSGGDDDEPAPRPRTPVPPTDEPAPPNTPVPPTQAPVPPTQAPVPPTQAPVPPTQAPPPPTQEPVPPTEEPVPPTEEPDPPPQEPPDNPPNDEKPTKEPKPTKRPKDDNEGGGGLLPPLLPPIEELPIIGELFN